MFLLGQAVLNYPELSSPQVQSLLKRLLSLLAWLSVSRLGQELNFLLDFLPLFLKVLQGPFCILTLLLRDPLCNLLESEAAGPWHQEVLQQGSHIILLHIWRY